MIFNRVFGQPTGETFSCLPIGEFVRKYLKESSISVDCFARNKRWATYTNDLNPNTQAEYHLDVIDFLNMLISEGVIADLVIFDPPFSPTQMKLLYEDIGLKFTLKDTHCTASWLREKELIHQILSIGGIFLQFGWDSTGINGAARGGYRIEEILLVNHGAAHNDTICMAERKIEQQARLF